MEQQRFGNYHCIKGSVSQQLFRKYTTDCVIWGPMPSARCCYKYWDPHDPVRYACGQGPWTLEEPEKKLEMRGKA